MQSERSSGRHCALRITPAVGGGERKTERERETRKCTDANPKGALPVSLLGFSGTSVNSRPVGQLEPVVTQKRVMKQSEKEEAFCESPREKKMFKDVTYVGK